MVNIKNPQTPNSNYQVTVTTRDPANAVIDGPTASTAYNIKQIGRDDIAGSAITGPKIADNTITSTKPHESFMKRVTLRDDPAGNAAGWNPSGGIHTFVIQEPTMAATDSVFFSIEVVSQADNVNRVCDVVDHLGFATFIITCLTQPLNGDELHYVVGNLPPHVAT